jgi:hypothetical protein
LNGAPHGLHDAIRVSAPAVQVIVDVPVQVSDKSLDAVTVRVRRCCRRHEDWDELAQHLIADFPTVAPETVLTQVTRAAAGCDEFGLAETDGRETAELITRYQLMLLTGELVDNARTDPQTARQRSSVGRRQ